MTNNKQSSVEWLISQLKISTYWNTLIAELEFMDLEIDDILEQAKAMHKEEIENAHLEGQCDETEGYPLEIAKKFYNETYGDNK